MTTQKISILLTFFIFVMAIHVEANDINWVKYAANRDTYIKVYENTGPILTRVEPAKKSIGSAEKIEAEFEPIMPFDSTEKPDSHHLRSMNCLKAFEKIKNFSLKDSLFKVISPYHFFHHVWKDRFLIPREMVGVKSLNSGLGQSIFNLYPNVDNHPGEAKILPTFKLLQSKGEETFKEIFMGVRLSLDPKSTDMLVEINISPTSDKGPGVTIPF